MSSNNIVFFKIWRNIILKREIIKWIRLTHQTIHPNRHCRITFDQVNLKESIRLGIDMGVVRDRMKLDPVITKQQLSLDDNQEFFSSKDVLRRYVDIFNQFDRPFVENYFADHVSKDLCFSRHPEMLVALHSILLEKGVKDRFATVETLKNVMWCQGSKSFNYAIDLLGVVIGQKDYPKLIERASSCSNVRVEATLVTAYLPVYTGEVNWRSIETLKQMFKDKEYKSIKMLSKCGSKFKGWVEREDFHNLAIDSNNLDLVDQMYRISGTFSRKSLETAFETKNISIIQFVYSRIKRDVHFTESGLVTKVRSIKRKHPKLFEDIQFIEDLYNLSRKYFKITFDFLGNQKIINKSSRQSLIDQKEFLNLFNITNIPLFEFNTNKIK
ncbi:hypothetical protein DFA_08333 [Cavenderia fasciculata]|uniref:Uncharacterized protein n=1 Tax=Cavenderia fasciculata TaxID=261658 RepID=F4Q5S9_CACFS|nr:uncharacterized protein DFA_08333 [Cavenderia fasciculata]EGG17338.1 hypothetical protein DFA_08333 [Cavenderia fasciculata]|eukprot:XP_004355822.1 hypothetical protein DFA_08333 [Cavenderia fasciculata]